MIVGVWQRNTSSLQQLLGRLLPADALVVARASQCDLMISDGPMPDAAHPCRCQLAVVSGDQPLDCEHLLAARVITYGLSGRNTLTVSSVDDQRLFLALQREIVGLTGTRLERQELVVRHMPATPLTLATATALLAYGAAPQTLEHIFGQS